MATYDPVNRVKEYTDEGRELLDHYPVAAIGIAFGVGVAAGLAIANMLTEPVAPQRNVAYRLGEQLMDAMSSMIPDTLSKFRG
jgi:hypothetical protein